MEELKIHVLCLIKAFFESLIVTPVACVIVSIAFRYGMVARRQVTVEELKYFSVVVCILIFAITMVAETCAALHDVKKGKGNKHEKI